MSETIRQSRDELIQSLHVGMSDFSVVDKTIQVIQFFEVDPLMLERELPALISKLSSHYLSAEEDTQLKISRIYYQFAKIFLNRRVRVHIPVNIYDLKPVLQLLTRKDNWYCEYFLMSWLTMLVMSPFKFDNDTDIMKAVAKFDNVALIKPLQSMVKAELWSRNERLYVLPDDLMQMDIIDLNYFLKMLKHKSKYPFTTEQLTGMTEHITSLTSFNNELEGLYLLKLLPKLTILLADSEETWQCIYDIIFWLTSSINLSFTDLRFKLAKTVSKIVLFISNSNPTSAEMIVEDCVEDTEKMIQTNTNDSMDAERLHTLLLVLAEFCRNKLLTVSQIEAFTSNILPTVSKFQQKRMMSTQGHQIRDAGNFFCWSLSRDYTNIPLPCLEEMFLSLLFTANFDHSPLIRKSAMAALQECLGRQGNKFLDNVVVVRLVEIHLGQLSNARLLYQLFKDNYPQYCEKMVEWLVLFTIGKDYEYQLVKSTTDLLSTMISEFKDDEFNKLVSKFNLKLAELGLRNRDTDICARSSYLNFKIGCQTLTIQKDILDVLHKYSIPKVWNEQVSFQALSELYGLLSLAKRDHPLSKDLAERVFMIVRNVKSNDYNHKDISNLFNELVFHISKHDECFLDDETKQFFWKTFDNLFKFEQPLVCSAAPFLYQHQFISLFYDVVPKISCEFKGKMINSLSEALPSYEINDDLKQFLKDVLLFLEDYTTTNQGDVGRITRLSTINLIAEHMELFQDAAFSEILQFNLLRLMGEPATELREKSFELLCRFENVHFPDMPFDSKIIALYHKFYKWNREFWKGYFFSAGAIHSTDKQISSAVDQLMAYYITLDEEERLRTVKEFVHIIPSASELKDLQENNSKKNIVGAIRKDGTKTILTFMNGWCRLLESGLELPNDFSSGGFFARVYNLQLAAKSVSITTYSFKLLTSLVCNQLLNETKASKQLANSLIGIFLKGFTKMKHKTTFSNTQKVALELLIQIYMCSNKTESIALLKDNSESPQQLCTLDHTLLFL